MTDPRLELVFNAAAERSSAAERAAYLDGACANDPELRGRVETLLRAHDDAGRFLAPTHCPEEVDESIGSTIDRYRLLQKIGEGGFGVVYMAEQVDPVRRKVALKIIKLGLETKQVVARFESERQALALMDHPNIARVFDGGTTTAGRPYFVMELVRGIPLSRYCDQHHLPAADRLRLFIDVCRAVQHAHQKGVIHRDLKPANVLVTLHDGRPVPKVIDFGIAKATHQRLTDKTLFTEFRQIIGTPQYMSPEQAEMSGLDVDTRSDVYSLGVMLYELLTGTTPLSSERLSTAGYAEMQRLIREEDPPEPSRRVSTLKDELTTVARDRGVEPLSLRRLIRGDLDWIVMKALEKDRTRRYATAAELADDLQRHLDRQPVQAGPRSLRYSVSKFLGRHRLAALLGCVILAALLGGLALAAAGFVTARQEAARARDIARFLEDILMAADQSGAQSRLIDVERVTAQARQLFGDDHATVATALGSLARQLDHGGEFQAADRYYVEAADIWERVGNRVQRARLLGQLGAMRRRRGDTRHGFLPLRESVKIADELPPALRLDLYESYLELAACEQIEGETEAAITHLRQAQELLDLSPEPQKYRAAELLSQRSNLLIIAGRDAEAEPLLRQMIDAWRELLSPNHPTVAYHQVMLAIWLRQRGRAAEAEPHLREAIRIYRESPQRSPEFLLLALDGLFQIVVTRDTAVDESIDLFRQCMAEMASLYGPDNLLLAPHFVGFARFLEQRRRWAEMIPFLIEGIRIQRQADSGSPPARPVEPLLEQLDRVARRVVAISNLPADSYAHAREAADFLMKEPHPAESVRELRAMVRYREGEFQEALQGLPERTPPDEREPPRRIGPFIDRQVFRALSLFRTGDRAAAQTLLDGLTTLETGLAAELPSDSRSLLQEARHLLGTPAAAGEEFPGTGSR